MDPSIFLGSFQFVGTLSTFDSLPNLVTIRQGGSFIDHGALLINDSLRYLEPLHVFGSFTAHVTV